VWLPISCPAACATFYLITRGATETEWRESHGHSGSVRRAQAASAGRRRM
jgi:hypothetical protein